MTFVYLHIKILEISYLGPPPVLTGGGRDWIWFGMEFSVMGWSMEMWKMNFTHAIWESKSARVGPQKGWYASQPVSQRTKWSGRIVLSQTLGITLSMPLESDFLTHTPLPFVGKILVAGSGPAAWSGCRHPDHVVGMLMRPLNGWLSRNHVLIRKNMAPR